jgi:hypothetical protein
LLILRASGADGVYTPALFLASGKEQVACMKDLIKTLDIEGLFLYDI